MGVRNKEDKVNVSMLVTLLDAVAWPYVEAPASLMWISLHWTVPLLVGHSVTVGNPRRIYIYGLCRNVVYFSLVFSFCL